jgi:hypothetical protein
MSKWLTDFYTVQRNSAGFESGFEAGDFEDSDVISVLPRTRRKTGACCHDDGTCDVLTEAACIAAGGNYQGDRTPCDPNPCCCPTATLVCDQISASKSKCGFRSFGSHCVAPDNKFWLSQVSTVDFYDGLHPHCVDSLTSTYNPSDCSLSYSGGGGGCGLGTFTCDCGIGGTGACIPPLLGCGESAACCTPSISPTNATFTSDCGVPSGARTVTTAALSSEYTTAALIANTIAALPSYDGVFDDDYEASKDLSHDESSYSISRFRYKFTWSDPLVIDCPVSWIERTYDDAGHKVSDNPMSETVSAGSTESSVYEVMEPGANGSIEVVYPLGACCVGASCSITDAGDCSDMVGIWHGACSKCTPDPCSGACCVGGGCSVTDEQNCSDIGGEYQGAHSICHPNPCV